MSLLHTQSCESVHSGLDLFSVPTTQTSIEEGFYVEVYPLASLTPGAPIEYSISGATEDYLDLNNTYIHVQVKVVNGDGSNLEADSTTAPTNNFLHSLFSQVDMSLNGVLVTNSENTYPYRAMFETLLNYGYEAENRGFPQTSLFAHDTGGVTHVIRGDVNEGLKTRRSRAAGSAVIDLMGRLHLDMMNQERYVLNGVDVKLRLTPAKNAFCLLQFGENPDAKTIITHASLFVRKVKLNPAVVIAHAKALDRGTAKFPVNRAVIKTFTVPKGSYDVVKDNLFLNQTPNRLVLALVDSEAFNGSYTTNPFHFHHHNINFIGLTVDGKPLPAKPLTPDFTTGRFVRSYLTTLQASGIEHKNEGLGFSLVDFGTGYCLFSFDLTPSLLDGTQFELVKAVTLRIELKFAKALKAPVTIVVYGVLDAIIEIDKSRQVITDFTL